MTAGISQDCPQRQSRSVPQASPGRRGGGVALVMATSSSMTSGADGGPSSKQLDGATRSTARRSPTAPGVSTLGRASSSWWRQGTAVSWKRCRCSRRRTLRSLAVLKGPWSGDAADRAPYALAGHRRARRQARWRESLGSCHRVPVVGESERARVAVSSGVGAMPTRCDRSVTQPERTEPVTWRLASRPRRRQCLQW